MPLIHCPDCQTSISDAATACPKCGHPFRPPAPVVVRDTALTRNRGCGDLILYGVLAVVILTMGGCVLAMVTG